MQTWTPRRRSSARRYTWHARITSRIGWRFCACCWSAGLIQTWWSAATMARRCARYSPSTSPRTRIRRWKWWHCCLSTAPEWWSRRSFAIRMVSSTRCKIRPTNRDYCARCWRRRRASTLAWYDGLAVWRMPRRPWWWKRLGPRYHWLIKRDWLYASFAVLDYPRSSGNCNYPSHCTVIFFTTFINKRVNREERRDICQRISLDVR